MALQARNHTPWLLLITTRIGQGEFDKDAEEMLIDWFRNNLLECEGFAEACDKVLESDVTSIDPAICSQADLLHLMTVAIGKWLSAMMQAQAVSYLELASVQGYRVNPESQREDLISLALRFNPVITASQNPLSPTSPTPVDECEIAKAILKRSKRRIDVDEALREDQELHEELIEEMRKLLAKAGYDTDAYGCWLQKLTASGQA